MELTSTLLCSHCALASLTEETCSHCGGALSPSTLESITDLPVSSDLTSQASSDFHSSPDTPANSDPIEPPTNEIPKTTDSLNTSIYHPIFWGRGRTFFGIFIVNTLYTLLTLGIYSFWGRVRIRQFLSSQTSFVKIRFSYHGTGEELLKGSSKALLFFGIPYGFLSFVPIMWDQIPTWIPNVLAGMMAFCFIPIAVVGSHRYRLSRTSIGAIRFSFRGRVKDYMKIWFTGTFLTIITAGIYYPFFENARRKFLVSHTYLGNRHFTYHGTGKPIFAMYAKAIGLALLIFLGVIVLSASLVILLTLVDGGQYNWSGIFLSPTFLSALLTLFWAWCYLQAAKQRYFWNHTTFDQAPFQFTASTWNLIELRLTNFLMLVLTFGIAWPWVQIRNLQFLYYYLGLQGPIDFHRIEQEALDASPTGEELAGYFDAGFDLG